MRERIVSRLRSFVLEAKIGTFTQFKKIEPFDKLDAETLEKNRQLLMPYYQEYIRDVSRPDMAASLELTVFIYTICKLNGYSKLLDMGSGLSSFVFRLYANETPGVQVYSVDDDVAWLEKTKHFLQGHKLEVKGIIPLEEFLSLGELDFDCILHDLNFVEVRINHVERLMKIAKHNGIVIFDDAHKTDYSFSLLRMLKKKHAKLYNLKPVTLDSYGRFSVAAIKE